jgi:hypothetical protein
MADVLYQEYCQRLFELLVWGLWMEDRVGNPW